MTFRVALGVVVVVAGMTYGASTARAGTPITNSGGLRHVVAPAMPSGAALLGRVAQAANSRGSVHIDASLNAIAVKKIGTGPETPWLQITSQSRTDESYRQNLGESYQVTRTVTVANGRTTSRTGRTHTIAVNQIAASQTDGHAWTCQRSKGAVPARTFALGMGYPVRNPVNRGRATLNGIAVWHVQGTITASWIVASSKPVRANYYINRADGTLVRENASPIAVAGATQSGATVHTIVRGTMSLTYSHWGEPVHPALPVSCRSR